MSREYSFYSYCSQEDKKQISCFNIGGGSPPLTTRNAQMVVTLSQRTDAICMGLDLVLEHHNAPSLIRAELPKQLHAYLDDSGTEGNWLKRSKYVLTYPLSKYLRNPLPPKPDRAFEPAGKVKRWLKARFNAFNRKNTHFWYSWLQCKRSSLPASSDIIEESYKKHLETLTRVDPGDDAIIGHILNMPIFERLLSKIKKDVAQRLQNLNSFEEYSASGSASFENPRRMSGQFGTLSKLVNDLDISGPRGTELWTMHCSPKIIIKGKIYNNVVTETRVVSGWEQWNALNVHLGEQTFFSSFQQPNCTIQGILEPMKVRIISKGPSLPYYGCKPLQVAIHSSLRNLNCFRLIGRPFCPTDLLDLAKKAKTSDHWFSVDYSAATDGLSWKYSGAIFRKVIEDLPYSTRLLAESVLGPHRLHYPVQGRKDVVFKGVQQNGQLMGSILSFPILCLANLGVYLMATEDLQYSWSDKARLDHVLINGDDMVYAADPKLWSRHVEIAGKVGLEMSVGKAYSHPVYANVNSTSVHFDLRNVEVPDVFHLESGKEKIFRETPYQIDYLNSGLFYGQHKVQDASSESKSYLRPLEGEDEKEAKWLTNLVGPERLEKLLKTVGVQATEDRPNLTSSMNKVLKGALPGKQKEILIKYLSVHSREIQLECLGLRKVGTSLKLFTRNLFLPICLGGLGVELPVDFKTEVKKVQLNVAYSLIRERNLVGLGSSMLPLPGYAISDLETRQSCPWSRNVAERQIFGSSSDVQIKLGRKKSLFYQGIPFAPNPSYYNLK
jgi:hypothetical protein